MGLQVNCLRRVNERALAYVPGTLGVCVHGILSLGVWCRAGAGLSGGSAENRGPLDAPRRPRQHRGLSQHQSLFSVLGRGGVGLGWGLRMFPGNRSPLGELPGQAQAPWAMS